MMRIRIPLLFAPGLVLLPLMCTAQLMPDADVLDQLRYDVRYLSSDRLEGREAGTEGERLAAAYIAEKFGSIGLMPYGDSATYLQRYSFAGDPVLGPNNVLQLGRKRLKLQEEYYPLACSSSGHVLGKVLKCGYGIQAPELDNDDYGGKDPKGRCVALSIGSPDGIHPHSKFVQYHDLALRARKAAELGATAVIFYDDDDTADPPDTRLSAKVKEVGIPVVFLMGDRYKTLLIDNNPVVVTVDIQRPRLTSMNVVGLLDNGKPHVAVVGAHYDHLGWGDAGSLHRGAKAIHHGADDNASGVAVMLQLARDLAELDEARGTDYLFIAFGGEEKGLLGSNHWTKNPTVPLEEIAYMINLDMVGRLDSTGRIGVNGVGTSPAWAEVERVGVGGLTARTTESGIGSSDHTSFYLQGIPALHFFTGTHADYHKPTDTEEKLNYPGMLRIARYLESLMGTLSTQGKLPFTSTQQLDSLSTPRFKVTMGVVPDYMYDGQGMRIDGVTEGKPAAAAGLRKGDVVIRIGHVEVTDMMAYMKGLGQFKKGETAPVTVLREGKELTVEVTF